MSTKTNFKRIALVAIGALGISLISAVPSTQAAVVGTPEVTVVNGTATTAKSDSTSAATIAVRYFTNEGSTETATIRFTAGSAPTGAASWDSRSILVTALDTSLATGGATTPRVAGSGAGGSFAPGAKGFGTDTVSAGLVADFGMAPGGVGNAYAKFGVWLDTNLARTVGTYKIDYSVRYFLKTGSEDTTKAAAGTINITVSEAGLVTAGTAGAAGTSTAVLYGGASFPSGTVVESTNVVKEATPSLTTAAGVIRVTQLTAAGAGARESITVSTNIGNVGTCAGTVGKSIVLQAAIGGVNDICIYPDGNGGTATINVSTTSVTFAPKTIKFYNTTVAKIEAALLGTVLGSTASNVILAKAYDDKGVQIVGDSSVYAYSSNTAVINTGTAPAGTECTYNSVYEGHLCSLAGAANGTADITLRNKSTSTLSTVASSALKITTNLNAATKVSLKFNKATYAPGEAAYIIVSATDSADTAVGAQTLTNIFASGGITSSVAFGNGSETTTAHTFAVDYTTASAGVASTTAVKLYKVFMPYSGGTVTVKATGGSLLPASGQVEVSASASVTDNGAAALAAVNALATTVASLRTLITTLTNLVLKIQKKVKA